MSGLDLFLPLFNFMTMKDKRAFNLLLVGAFTIGFSLTSMNAQAQVDPQLTAKKAVSGKQLIPLLDFIFSNKVNLKDTTAIKIEQPITWVEGEGSPSGT